MSSNGVPLPVKGTSTRGKESLTKIKVGLRAVPPPPNPEAADDEQPRRRRRTSSQINQELRLHASLKSGEPEGEHADEGDRHVRFAEKGAEKTHFGEDKAEEGGSETASEIGNGTPLGKVSCMF